MILLKSDYGLCPWSVAGIKDKGKTKRKISQMNKLIKLATIVAGVGAMLSFAGCGDGGSPDGVAKDVISCLKTADMEGVGKYSTGEFKKGILMLKGMMEGAEEKEVDDFKKEFANKKYEIGQAVIDGDKAKVPVKIDGKDKPISLIKVDGEWKVDDFNFKDM